MNVMNKIAAALALAMLATLAVGCADGGGGNGALTGDVYETRGIIRQLPAEPENPNMPVPELMIEHEPIPEFVGREGEVVGMDSMSMPFNPADDVSLEGLEVGDKVRLTFVWSWDQNANRLTEIEKLPGDTELDLGGAATQSE